MAVQMSHGVAVEDESEEIHGHLPTRAVARAVRLAGTDHIVDWRAGDVQLSLVEGERGGATYGHAVFDKC